MEVEVHAITDIGRVRKENEDNYLFLNLSSKTSGTKSNGSIDFGIGFQKFEVDDNGIVLAVSDGCGGALGGDMSSKMAVETVRDMLTGEIPNLEESFYEGGLIEKLYDATIYASHLIYHKGTTVPEYNQMGATFTATAITPDTVDFIQVGDSRAYLFRNNKIYQITKDQSLVNQLIDSGQISAEEADLHPLKNVILQALGAQNEVLPDAVRLIPNRDDILLLCSDGLSNKLKDQDLLKIILDNFNELENACSVLIQETNYLGGEDNITVILAKLSGSDLLKSTDDSVVIYPLNFENTAKRN
ncbi:MAG TPA: protein phosphatase 2C domain-containing protein [Pyrinomonadaceae bacterium]|nr:protein phosphatase 2C domain-containing protein [Pyrinomonadaceae bacterium]